MRILFKKSILAYGIITATMGINTYASAPVAIGIDHIGDHDDYAVAAIGGGRYHDSGNWQSNGSCYYTAYGAKGSRTLVGDVKQSALDQNRFDLALLEKDFTAAWSMCGDTDQGRIWQRMTVSCAKNTMHQLIKESVYEEDLEKKASANAIAEIFPEPHRAALAAYGIEEEEAAKRGFSVRLKQSEIKIAVLERAIADTKLLLEQKIQALTALQSTIGALSAARSISPAPQRAVAHAAGVLPPPAPVRTASPLKK
jgi:hypothetical protein